MSHLAEPEIYYGSLAFPDAQTYFAGSPNPTHTAIFSEASWYDTSVDPHRGAFAMVRSGSDLERLVGEFVRVRHRGREVFLYVIGGADLPEDFGITRRAWMELAVLWADSRRVRIDILQDVPVPK